MSNIDIGMKAVKAKELCENILKQIEAGGKFSVDIYGEDNSSSGEITISIANEDMERDELADDAVFVDVY